MGLLILRQQGFNMKAVNQKVENNKVEFNNMWRKMMRVRGTN